MSRANPIADAAAQPPANVSGLIDIAIRSAQQVTQEQIMNCTATVRQRNFIQLTDCSSIYNTTIDQTNAAVIRAECTQLGSGNGFVLAALQTQLEEVASNLAESIYQQWITSLNQSADALQTLCQANGYSRCEYSEVLRASVNLVNAVSASVLDTCNSTMFQNNSFTCTSNNSALDTLVVRQTNLYSKTAKCVSTTAAVQTARQELADLARDMTYQASASPGIKSLPIVRELLSMSMLIALIVYAVVFLVLMIVSSIAVRRQRTLGSLALLCVFLTIFPAVMTLAWRLHLPPYAVDRSDPDIAKRDELYHLLSVGTLVVLTGLSVLLSVRALRQKRV